MRLFNWLIIYVLGTSIAFSAGRGLPDLKRCASLKVESSHVSYCLRRSDDALNHRNAAQLDNRSRAIALTWRALSNSAKSGKPFFELTDQDTKLIDEAIKLDPRNILAISLNADRERLSGRFDEAERLVEVLQAINAKDPMTILMHARLSESRGDLTGAQRLYTDLIAKRAFLSEAYASRARVFVGLQQPEAARADVRNSLKPVSKDEKALLEVVQSVRTLGLGSEALPAIDSFLRKQRSGPLLFERAWILFESKDYLGAHATLTDAILLNPAKADLYLLRGRSAFLIQRVDHAFLDMTQAETFDPKDARVPFWRAIMLKELKRAEEAVSFLDKAIALDPNVAVYWFDRGLLNDELNKNQAALLDYTKSIEINKNYKEAYNNRGLIYFHMDFDEEAETDYLIAAKIDNKYVFPIRNLVNLYGYKFEKTKQQSYKEKGIASLQELFNLAPGDMFNILARGRFYKRIGDCEKSKIDLLKYLDFKNDNISAISDLAWCFIQTNNFSEAVFYLEKSINLSPNNAVNINNMSWSKFKLGQLQEALVFVERALTIRPNFPAGLNTRAHIRAGLGDRDGAISDHRTVLRLAAQGSVSFVDSENALKEMGEVP